MRGGTEKTRFLHVGGETLPVLLAVEDCWGGLCRAVAGDDVTVWHLVTPRDSTKPGKRRGRSVLDARLPVGVGLVRLLHLEGMRGAACGGAALAALQVGAGECSQ